ncbi:ATP-grasp domain-containing protein [Staphylococcus agnetis]|uniref:ATP-grasp domain-containing protein n=1 Tax=Staphylococcus agnetis TaxID=985762 RepID=UPI00208FB374|nr:ATP-grasp domain-containing protein [Staphylococcus agnetis]MCO4365751.1 ATP-grasp domain-containing protein [Staphylococcus agnetis]
MKEYLLLLGAEQFLRERSYAGGKSVGNFEIWTAINNAKYNYNSYFDFCLNADPLNYDDLKKQVDFYRTKGYILKSVVPLNDWTLKIANRLNKEYALPYLDDNVIEACRNKKEMKNLFEQAKIPTAKSKNFYNETQLIQILSEFSFPIIIKPVDFGGSGGVYLANNLEEALRAYSKSQEIMDKYAEAFKVSSNEFLVEEFIESDDEVSVEVLCGKDFYEVITVTEKYLSPKPWFTEMGHVVPSHRYRDNNIITLAINTCKSLGINRGVAHVEIKVKDKDLYVIEAAARPGGDAIMDLIESSYGINPYSLHISMYIDNTQNNNHEFTPTKTSAIAFMKAPFGEITDIKFPDIGEDSEIIRINIFKKIGDKVGNPENWSHREGIVQFTFPKISIEKEYKHIEKSNTLSKEIFECRESINE